VKDFLVTKLKDTELALKKSLDGSRLVLGDQERQLRHVKCTSPLLFARSRVFPVVACDVVVLRLDSMHRMRK